MSEEIQDIKKDLKECIKTTTENSLAIKELITLSNQSTKDTDKLIRHIDSLLPIDERVRSVSGRVETLEGDARDGVRPRTLKELLMYATIILLGFGSWITLMYFSMDKILSAHIELQDERDTRTDIKMDKQNSKIEDNKNQITYLKGRIK